MRAICFDLIDFLVACVCWCSVALLHSANDSLVLRDHTHLLFSSTKTYKCNLLDHIEEVRACDPEIPQSHTEDQPTAP